MTKEELLLRDRLRKLTKSVDIAIAKMDIAMTRITPEARGRVVAHIINDLSVANEIAQHYGLGRSFAALRKARAEIARRLDGVNQ